MRIILAGGGTGGHLFPGLALAREIQTQCPAARVSFIGTASGLDLTLVPRAGYAVDVIAAGRGSPLNWRHPSYLPRFLTAIYQCRRLFGRERPDAVVALGGFAAAAPGIAARWRKIPLFILEQNVVPGRVNCLLARFAKQIFLQFAEAQNYFPPTAAEFVPVGSPLRAEIAALSASVRAALLIVGGSQGAAALNELVAGAMRSFIAAVGEVPIIHLTGAAEAAKWRDFYAAQKLPVAALGFSDRMADLYRRAKLVVSRSGAGAIAEMTALGLPAVLIPLPTAARNHQWHNAKWLADRGGAVLWEQPSLTAAGLAENLAALWRDDAALTSMAAAARQAARPSAGRDIAARILGTINN
ncbi:UDP-N-acetylglucosamine--N-acetylmuramyl-(pentapeptide) pyrophosphoryl-undecaprenol N-acetylglucosamine transferase [Planctomycetales bacterium]|nr:UDP-N-acetylglucosamine--N-acetylmuramyl-(pentapeptide) pyrophosphoryl-undecaprenol N-acetylglucosamine transferase [Planctomycetales bacterium]